MGDAGDDAFAQSVSESKGVRPILGEGYGRSQESGRGEGGGGGRLTIRLTMIMPSVEESPDCAR